jgi:RimJ/RimL family protein N-acetyltransferase
MTTWTIRPAHPDDAAAIIEYLKLLADEPENGTSFTDSSQIIDLESERTLIQSYVDDPNRQMWVAMAGDAVVGLSNLDTGGRMFFCMAVFGMSVHKDWRRQGIGRALLQHIVDFARNHPEIIRLELEVFTHNLRAIALYEQFGFQYDGLRRYVGFREGRYVDEHIMSILFEDKLQP